MRWPEGVRCAHCGSDQVGSLVRSGNRRLWNCKACKKQFTVKVGTIFQDSPLGLDKWLPAVWMIVNAKNGVSSCELSRSLGITQKSAWHMGHRIRTAMKEGGFTLSGEVEADETFIGGKHKNMHRRTKFLRGLKDQGASGSATGKEVVMGVLERGGKVRTAHLPKLKMTLIQAEVRKAVEPGSKLYTDALQATSASEANTIIRPLTTTLVSTCAALSIRTLWKISGVC